jgi:hypothetical protein
MEMLPKRMSIKNKTTHNMDKMINNITLLPLLRAGRGKQKQQTNSLDCFRQSPRNDA